MDREWIVVLTWDGKCLSLILFCHLLLNNLMECLLDSSLWVLRVSGFCVIYSYKIFFESFFSLFPRKRIQGQFAICCKNFINAPIFSSFLQEWSVQIICSPFLLQAGFAAQKPHPIIAKSLFSHYSFLSGGFVSSEQQSLCPKAWLGINNLTTCHRQQWTMLLGLKYS